MPELIAVPSGGERHSIAGFGVHPQLTSILIFNSLIILLGFEYRIYVYIIFSVFAHGDIEL